MMLGLVDCGSWLVFLAYITLFVNNNLLIVLTKDEQDGYSYSTVLVTLLIELFKLMVAVIFYCLKYSFAKLITDLQSNNSGFAFYLLPSALYSVFNNLAFLNLAYFDPTTYAVLLQFSIVVTGVLYQYMFKRDLTWLQWISLLVLTSGCILTHFKESKEVLFKLRDVFILLQVLCSSFASVYNEYLLKSYSSQVDFWLQSVFMYTDTSLCSVALMIAMGRLSPAMLTTSSMRSMFQPMVILIVTNNVTAGLVTGVFLHKLNSVLKKFAVAIEMIIIAVLSKFLLGTAVEISTAISVLLVSLSIILYSLNPLGSEREKVVRPDLKCSNGVGY
ncbi:CMP-sialic acid transporter 1-like [Acanthaster planci]|uniref:CMP-sialic acid transporter 1-like n=1 Tax=Acanthaster planci TaxID=133434 RepID=A0A8B7ZXP5_ACAPL|nr:CMP-sialic acid transporter 1-like [Acanthaster planci]XP_022110320.1 CMP-sialic acid transporter 1-like [Acanthaster planci]XP_022110321.1 CMP-sialic acid transporter 1-like [Acanthaster planci]XP_022110322.1 CMP-sialic acid transporter 1-like [Acanthaster planci]XP_022110323.1 CMP-sialic acid transporter 1-like [Acanthaster planci]